MLAKIFKKYTPEVDHLYKPETDSKVSRQIVKLRNEIYVDSEIPAYHAIKVANQLDEVLKYIDSVDMEVPRYGV